MTLKKAQEHQQNAYHLFTITYPLMQDPKIFLVVVLIVIFMFTLEQVPTFAVRKRAF